jgi:nucleotidyltransferase/DNA polymerase involved in DNA repair
MNRNIVHLDLDTFFVSVERLRDSSLKKKTGHYRGDFRQGGCSQLQL